MTEQEIIAKTMEFVKAELRDAEGGHDWFHIERVWKNTMTIARSETCDLFVAGLGALLHDIADHKFHSGDDTIGVEKARRFLESLQASGEVIDRVVKIMTSISFKGGNVKQEFFSPELAVVQDADRLDAIGAIDGQCRPYRQSRAFAPGTPRTTPGPWHYRPGPRPHCPSC